MERIFSGTEFITDNSFESASITLHCIFRSVPRCELETMKICILRGLKITYAQGNTVVVSHTSDVVFVNGSLIKRDSAL